MFPFRLKWPVAKNGYHIEDRPAKKEKGRSLIWEAGGGKFIVRNVGPSIERDVLKTDGLYHQFADTMATPHGALEFVTRHGFLTSSSARREGYDLIVSDIHAVRGLRDALKHQDWGVIQHWLLRNPKLFRLGLALEYSSDASPTLFFKINTLREAIYVQFFADMMSKANLRKCKRPGCPEWFTFGSGTKHRETAIYCSPTCQKAHAYMKSKET